MWNCVCIAMGGRDLIGVPWGCDCGRVVELRAVALGIAGIVFQTIPQFALFGF